MDASNVCALFASAAKTLGVQIVEGVGVRGVTPASSSRTAQDKGGGFVLTTECGKTIETRVMVNAAYVSPAANRATDYERSLCHQQPTSVKNHENIQKTPFVFFVCL